MIMTDAELLDEVDRFLARTEMAPTRFGLETLADGGLVKSLRSGRSLSLRNAAKLVAFMSAHESQADRAA